MSSVTTRYQITLSVLDESGVLAAIATLFSDHGVSVEAVSQSVRDGLDASRPTATLVIVTHEAAESSLASTVTALAASPVVAGVLSVLRVEGL
jgi:homoserine dehydrogenase